MTAPLRGLEPPPGPLGSRTFGEPQPRRVRRALRGCARAVLGWATRPARLLPGLAAVACGVAGTFLLWGLGVALLVAAGFFLLLDARTPRG
jgi:hypothetical protein